MITVKKKNIEYELVNAIMAPYRSSGNDPVEYRYHFTIHKNKNRGSWQV